MIRFVDIRNNKGMCDRFAFYNTITDKFCELGGEQTWTTKKEFQEAFESEKEKHEDVSRFLCLMPEWTSVEETEEEFEKRFD